MQAAMESSTRGSRRKTSRPSLKKSVRENLVKTLKEKNLEFRFKPVEDAMAPLIHQVSPSLLAS